MEPPSGGALCAERQGDMVEQKPGPDSDREHPPARNTLCGTAQSVLQTGTHHGDTIIHPPPERQAGRMWLAGGALLAGVVIVLAVVVVVLREWPGGTTGLAQKPAPEPVAVRCPDSTHVLYSGRSSMCEVDNPAMDPPHVEAQWSGGGTTVVAVGERYGMYFSNNGGTFAVLGNGVANANGDAVTFHRKSGHSGYFKIAGTTNAGYCIEFDVDADAPEEPATPGVWHTCYEGQ